MATKPSHQDPIVQTAGSAAFRAEGIQRRLSITAPGAGVTASRTQAKSQPGPLCFRLAFLGPWQEAGAGARSGAGALISAVLTGEKARKVGP